jgi:hypothetical protein
MTRNLPDPKDRPKRYTGTHRQQPLKAPAHGRHRAGQQQRQAGTPAVLTWTGWGWGRRRNTP